MQRTTTNHRQRKNAGFTLIEMLVIAPSVMLLIGTMIIYLTVLTGDSLRVREKAQMVYSTERALDRLEEDIRLSVAFEDETFPNLPNAQSANGAGFKFDVVNRPFPTNDSFYGAKRILRGYATNKNPLDPTKKIVYSTTPTPSNCGTVNEYLNKPLDTEIVYYMKLDSGEPETGSYSLWRRMIINPNQTACPGSTIWQRKSCAPGYSDPVCQTEDEKILENLPRYNFGGYYGDIPDRSYTPSAPHAPLHYIDCIKDCLIIGYNAGSPVLDPYSRVGDNKNARTTNILLSPTKEVAGETISYHASGYFKRSDPIQ